MMRIGGCKNGQQMFLNLKLVILDPKPIRRFLSLCCAYERTRFGLRCTAVQLHFMKFLGIGMFADKYAIVVGTSHCEPMLCNINSEWDKQSMGEWRYDVNETNIQKLFQSRVNETSGFESIYTMGMRGEHDSPMFVDESVNQVELLEKVITDQRDMLESNTGRDPSQIPQVFIPYKEVLAHYNDGLELPEDVTLMWTDDNYGYIRRLSNKNEQKRSGGAGVYYHTSYWGRPHDYLWLNSTPPVLMWSEMLKAFNNGAQEMWILNCGDIKPHEYAIELFLDLAWDTTSLDSNEEVMAHGLAFYDREFGADFAQEVYELQEKFYNVSYQRRPEFMAWSTVEPVTNAGPTELSFIHYGGEDMRRIDECLDIKQRVLALSEKIPAEKKDAFFELVKYPLVAGANMNLKWLYHYRNKFVSNQKRWSANDYAEGARQAYDEIVTMT